MDVVDKFAKMLDKQVESYFAKEYPDSNAKGAHDRSKGVKIKRGKQYIKIDVGDSGKFMYDTENGHLYFIKGYGVINRKKDYGPLDKIVKKGFEFDGYSIHKKSGPTTRGKHGYAGPITERNDINQIREMIRKAIKEEINEFGIFGTDISLPSKGSAHGTRGKREKQIRVKYPDGHYRDTTMTLWKKEKMKKAGVKIIKKY